MKSSAMFILAAAWALPGCETSDTQPHEGFGGTSSATTLASSGGIIGTGGKPGAGGNQGTGGKQAAGGRVGTGGDGDDGSVAGSGGRTVTDGAVVDGRAAYGDAADGKTGDGKTRSGGTGGGTQATGGTQGYGGSTGQGTLRKFFGNIDTSGKIRSDFASMWDQFTPENAGKWGSVQGGGESSFNWASLDAMYKYTQDNGILFKEHTFCWGPQQPPWVNNSNGEKAVKAWMKAFCERYPKTVMIDVFNESLHNSPSYKEGIGGTGSTGYDWLVNAFKWAKEACPNAILLYNDYNTIEYANENSGVIKLVNAVKKAGGPIDGVGCQSHDVAKVSASTVIGYVEKIIKETGLPVYITEIDVGVADDNQQMKILKDIVEPLWKNDNVKGWTYWGYISGATWRSNTGLMSSSGTKRAALTWLMDFLGR
jgi:endo-1,4-beta-xylanase